MSKVEESNYIYNLIENNQYTIQTSMLALSGSVTFGVPGFIGGLSVSLIDQTLVYYNLNQDRYLTKAFIGVTLGYSAYPSYIVAILGGILGVTPTKYTYEMIANYNISHPLISTLAGASKNGINGAIVGGVAGFVDKFLIYSNTTDKHYLTYSLVSVTVVSSIFGNTFIVNSIAFGFGIILANYENNFDLGFKSINFAKDLSSQYSKIINPEIITNLTNEYIETILVSQIIIQKLTLVALKYQQDMIHNFEHINARLANNFNSIALNLLSSIIFSSIFKLYSYLISDYFSSRLYVSLDDNLRNLLFSNNTAIEISFDQDSRTLIDNLRHDSRIVSREGSKLISNALFKITSSMYATALLISNAPDILLYSILYNQLNYYVSRLLSKEITLLDSKIKSQESAISTYLKHDMQNIKIIVERNGLDYSSFKVKLLYDQLSDYESQKEQVSIVFDIWISFSSTFDFFFSYYLVGIKIHNGELNFEDRMKIHHSSGRVFRMLSMDAYKSKETDIVYSSLERLELFLKKASNVDKPNSNSCADIILREFENSETRKLTLSYFRIITDNQLLLETDDLNLVFGEIYGFTGPSGSGKTSLALKIAGITINQICGEGTIKYPSNTKIVIVSQQDYFALNTTLQEVIFYPDHVNESMVDEVRNLLDKTGVTQFKLDQIENWYDVLSGGQKKIVLIISALIKDPDILILDESFNGIDKVSTRIVQELIKLHLNKSLIISIDHNINANNETGFYNHLLQVANKKVVLFEDIHDAEQINIQDNTHPWKEDMCYINTTSTVLGEDICVL